MLLGGFLNEGTHIIDLGQTSRLQVEGMPFTYDRSSDWFRQPGEHVAVTGHEAVEPLTERQALIAQARARLEEKSDELFEMRIKVEADRIITKNPDAIYTVKEHVEHAAEKKVVLILEDQDKRCEQWILHFWWEGSPFALEASHPFGGFVWERDHDLDYPWVLYFNDEAMPKWANCWYIYKYLPQPVHELLGQSTVTSSSFIDDLFCRMNEAHRIRSEDSNLFRLTVLRLLAIFLQHENQILLNMRKSGLADAAELKEVFDGVIDGFRRMHDLALRDGMAMWTAGYQEDGNKLKEAIRRYRLPVSDPQHLEPPHIVNAQAKVARELRAARKRLQGISKARRHREVVKDFIEHIPTVTVEQSHDWYEKFYPKSSSSGEARPRDE